MFAMIEMKGTLPCAGGGVRLTISEDGSIAKDRVPDFTGVPSKELQGTIVQSCVSACRGCYRENHDKPCTLEISDGLLNT